MDVAPIRQPLVSTDTVSKFASHVVPQLNIRTDKHPTPLSQLLFISVLYIFAGEHRKSDVGDLLYTMHISGEAEVNVFEVDLLRSPDHDVTVRVFWDSILARIKLKEWQVVIVTPPCNTHSRARNANNWGPPPVRSKLYPYGYPWLTGVHLQEVELANLFVELTFEACDAAHSVEAAFLIEHPEDLGATADLQQPASIFGLVKMRDLVQKTGAGTVALHQCPWGAPSSKPTRIVSTLDLSIPDEDNKLYHTWPVFSKTGQYEGPLPRNCGHRHKGLLGRSTSGGKFRTASAASYPAGMCRWIVRMIIKFCKISHVSP
jgi:hypothetical protein